MADTKKLFENFAIMIPETAIYKINDCLLFGATTKEYEDFKKWFDKSNYQQLSLNEMKIDMWIRWNDMVIDHTGYSIQDLFERWKEKPPSKEGYTVITHKY